MQKNIKRMFIGCVAVLATAAVFSLTVKNSSLESLRANALIDASGDTKCVRASNCDCESPSTGTIYCGYKAKTVGTN